MTRIAMISYHTCPLATLGGKDTGGMNVYVRDLTRFLGQIGIHVDVFTRSQDEHVPHVLHDLGYGNRVVHIPAGPEVPLQKEQLASYIPDFVAGIRKFSQEKNIHYDLIHSHYWMSGMAALSLKEAWSVPIVQMFHTLGVMKNSVAQNPGEIEGDYRLNGEKKVIAGVDRITAATLSEKEQLVSLYHADERKINVISPGVDISRFYPIPKDEARAFVGTPPDEQMILFVGRIEPLKGVEVLMRAISLMRKKGVACEIPHYLAIIGGEPDSDEKRVSAEMARLKLLCGELDLCEMAVFLGKRSQDILPYYYSAADLLVMPSLYESFGLVALESMACGTPVVASKVGGLAYLVRDGVNGYTVSDGDIDALSAQITALLRHPQHRENLGRQAIQFAQDYSWEKIASRIADLYGNLISTSD